MPTTRIHIIKLTQISQTPLRSSLAQMALGPIRLDVDGLVGILEGLLVITLGTVDSRSVGVEDVVFGLDRDGLGELVTVSLSAESR